MCALTLDRLQRHASLAYRTLGLHGTYVARGLLTTCHGASNRRVSNVIWTESHGRECYGTEPISVPNRVRARAYGVPKAITVTTVLNENLMKRRRFETFTRDTTPDGAKRRSRRHRPSTGPVYDFTKRVNREQILRYRMALVWTFFFLFQPKPLPRVVYFTARP